MLIYKRVFASYKILLIAVSYRIYGRKLRAKLDTVITVVKVVL